MKTIIFTLLMAFSLVCGSQARPIQGGTYDTLNDKATLIVIATPTKGVVGMRNADCGLRKGEMWIGRSGRDLGFGI